MANLAFELGFDWKTHPIIGVRDGVYPLQICLVDDDEGTVISPFKSSSIQVGDNLTFRVYDITDYVYYEFTDDEGRPDNHPVPNCVQVLFTSAMSDPPPAIFSPFEIPFGMNEVQLAELSTTNITDQDPVQSIAFGNAASFGWNIPWQGGSTTISNSGRFKLRALVTVGVLGEKPKIYRVDPEMIVGGGGGSGGGSS